MQEEIADLVNKAVAFDRNGKLDAAIYFYGEAASELIEAVKLEKVDKGLVAKAKDYLERAETLRDAQAQSQGAAHKSTQQKQLERAEFLLYQALNEDEDGDDKEAFELYTEAVELCIGAQKGSDDDDVKKKLGNLAKQALDRATELKSRMKPAATSLSPKPPEKPYRGKLFDDEDVPKSSGRSISPQPRQNAAAAPQAADSNRAGGYTDYEIRVLRATSRINGREYVPFMSVDMKERFAFHLPFTDKDGLLALSSKQKEKFARWARPEEFTDQPVMIASVDSLTVKQTVISDCSFIASLCISASYEKKFNKRILSRIIFPQDKRGQPVYNPCGKYMIKLQLNGVSRKIIIDDQLPIGRHGQLLCSFSNNRSELWVSLLEKAYMKVMGGYDFPGSNSNIDLHALTNWIPERMSIHRTAAGCGKAPEDDFNSDAVFDKILDRFHKGDCLVTLATGSIPEADADRAGLVECHAYAMLDIRKCMGKQLLLLKNPWNHLRWKGRYSDRDARNWTPELKKALRYDPASAQQHDDGIFWIDYDSLLNFFDVFYVNWNPALFPYTHICHASWNAGAGPARDLYSMGDNPQYLLDVTASTRSSVWVLLTRHIVDKDDFANNKEYITLLVYKNGGKRVYIPFDPPPHIDGTRINSPHYLVKIPVSSSEKFTLVVSQYEKSVTIAYTLRTYSTVPFSMKKFDEEYVCKETVAGKWTEATAGGCANYRETFKNNPIYQINLDSSVPSDLYMDIKGPKEFSVGFDVLQVSGGASFPKQSTVTFRPGYNVLSLSSVPGGTYNIIPQTFRPGKIGNFILTVKATSRFRMVQMR